MTAKELRVENKLLRAGARSIFFLARFGSTSRFENRRIPAQNKVWRQTRKSPKWLKDRIAKVLVEIKENPLAGIRLHGELEGYYKYRVGDYRIVYRFDSKNSLVVVVKIEHRQGVYK